MLDATSPSFFIHIIIAVLILVGNTLVIYLYFSDRFLRKISNKFVISLAFCDLLIALVFIPCHEFFGDVIAKAIRLPLSGYVASIASYGSLLNLSALTYDRYIAIFHGLRYHAIMTRKRASIMMVSIWTSNVIISMLPLSWKFVTSEKLNSFCLHIYQTILIVIIIFVHLIITLFYIKVFLINRQHLEQARKDVSRFKDQVVFSAVSTNHKSDRKPRKTLQKLYNSRAVAVEIKAARVVMLMFLINTICWLPTVILNVVYLISWYQHHPFVPQLLFQISKYSFLSYSVVNPWIYALLKDDFRKSFKKKFQRRFGSI